MVFEFTFYDTYYLTNWPKIGEIQFSVKVVLPFNLLITNAPVRYWRNLIKEGFEFQISSFTFLSYVIPHNIRDRVIRLHPRVWIPLF